MQLLLKKGIIKDPKYDYKDSHDILIEDGKIKKIAPNIEKKELKKEVTVIDLAEKIVLPGLIDLHTHLREPGFEEKETIKTGAEAAAAGGFTSIACMPNTRPVADNPATIEFIKSKAQQAVVKVYPIGSISKDLAGEELSEIGFLAEAGVTALSDDGKTVMDGEIMRRAMEYATGFDLTVIDHCEDINLVGEGVMNEGYFSTVLGLKGIPSAAEEVIIARDIILAELTGCPVHIAHLSTKKGVEMVAEAKEKGLAITAEVTPHHLILTDQAVMSFNPDTKVNPPLRSEEDRAALRKGLQDGTIDMIATDHAPHTYEDKLGEFDLAANGISGLETALSLIYHHLIQEKIINWDQLVEQMVYQPSKILKLNQPGLEEGSSADITVFDPEQDWNVNPNKFKSKGSNTPFAGDHLQGRTCLTVVDGKIVYDNRSGKHEIIY